MVEVRLKKDFLRLAARKMYSLGLPLVFHKSGTIESLSALFFLCSRQNVIKKNVTAVTRDKRRGCNVTEV